MTVSMRRAIFDLDRAERRTLAAQINVSREDLADFAELASFELPASALAALESWWEIHQLRLILKGPSPSAHLADICAATGVDRMDYDAFVAGENNLGLADRDKLRAFALGRYGLSNSTGKYIPPSPPPHVGPGLGVSAAIPAEMQRLADLLTVIRTFPLHEVEAFVANRAK